jgi:hypothetical protein
VSQAQDPGQQRGRGDLYVTAVGAGVVVAAFVVLLILAGTALIVVGNDSNQLAVATAAFGVLGTLVGAYFGVKASDDARRQTQRQNEISSIFAQESLSRLPDQEREEARKVAHDRIAREVGPP